MRPIKSLVRSHVHEATLLSNVGAEVSFQLPNDSSSSFQSMLTEIDSRKVELGINRYTRGTRRFALSNSSPMRDSLGATVLNAFGDSHGSLLNFWR